MANKKKLTNVESSSEKLTRINVAGEKLTIVNKNSIQEKRPHIGITYLSDKKYGLNHLFKCNRGNSKYLSNLQKFVEMSRNYKSISQLIEYHKSHKCGTKNDDDKSKKELTRIKNKYKVETDEMIHIHTSLNGNGEFVLHGFIIKNIFEIVWLDCHHDVHK